MRVLIWNIRAGGGRRIEDIAARIERWRCDVVGLSEFRATPPSCELAEQLAACGLVHQRTTADPGVPARNALLLAARWPLRRIRLRREPDEPGRWLMARVGAPDPITVGLLHAPNYVTGRKYPFLDAVLDVARGLGPGPALIGGDSNSTRRDLDEQVPFTAIPEEHFIEDMRESGWADGYRAMHGRRRVYSWYSPNGGNGYRLDQAFVNGALRKRLLDVRYRWARRKGDGGRRDTISDHAAVVVDLGGSAGRPARAR